MNFRLWWFELKNSQESIGWILLLGLALHWGALLGQSRPLFEADSTLLLPFLTTHFFYGLLNGILWLPVVLVFRTSQLGQTTALEQFLTVLPQSRWVIAFHRYLRVLASQLVLLAILYLGAKAAFFFSTVSGFRPMDRQAVREAFTMLVLSQAFIAIFYLAIELAPRRSFALSWLFSAALIIESWILPRRYPMDLVFEDIWVYVILSALVLIGVEITFYMRKKVLTWL